MLLLKVSVETMIVSCLHSGISVFPCASACKMKFGVTTDE